MKEVRAYARKNDLKPSFTYYKQWGRKGKKPTIKLRFSKYGDEGVEKGYATHYVSSKRMAELKQSQNGNSSDNSNKGSNIAESKNKCEGANDNAGT